MSLHVLVEWEKTCLLELVWQWDRTQKNGRKYIVLIPLTKRRGLRIDGMKKHDEVATSNLTSICMCSLYAKDTPILIWLARANVSMWPCDIIRANKVMPHTEKTVKCKQDFWKKVHNATSLLEIIYLRCVHKTNKEDTSKLVWCSKHGTSPLVFANMGVN